MKCFYALLILKTIIPVYHVRVKREEMLNIGDFPGCIPEVIYRWPLTWKTWKDQEIAKWSGKMGKVGRP